MWSSTSVLQCEMAYAEAMLAHRAYQKNEEGKEALSQLIRREGLTFLSSCGSWLMFSALSIFYLFKLIK